MRDPVLEAQDRSSVPLQAWLAAVRSYAEHGYPPLTDVERLGAEAQRAWAAVLAVAEDQPTEGGR